MIKKRGFPKIFPGWWIVLTGGILALWGHGYHSYGFSALFKPISTELGFGRAATSIPASIGRLEGGFEAPLTGWATDRFGPKWVVLFGVALIGVSLICMGFIESLWSFYIVWGIMLGTGINIGLSLPIGVAITNWFVKKRGIALGIRMVFSGLSGVVVLPLIAWMITIYGWRFTCVIGGIVMLLVGLPMVWFFLRQRRPEYYGLLPDGAIAEEMITDQTKMIHKGVKYAAEVEELEYTFRQAVRTPSFWLLITANACHSLVGPAISIHGIPFLTDLEIDSLKAAGMMAMMIGASLPTRFFGGLLADRVAKRHLRFLLGGAYFLQCVGFAVYLLNQTLPMIYVWFIIYGIGMGIGYGLMMPIRARYFGRKAFGSIAGASRMLMTPIGIATPIYLGWVYDTSGNYISAFTVITILLGVSTLLAFLVIPPKPPDRITDIHEIV